MLASICQIEAVAGFFSTVSVVIMLFFGGFIIPKRKDQPNFYSQISKGIEWFTDRECVCVCIIFNLTDSLPAWLRWGFWLSPVSYAEIGVSVTEFLAPRWEKVKMRPKFYYYVMVLFLGKIKDESVTYI